MARKRTIYYSPSEELAKKNYYQGLPEKAKRHFLGQEYLNLGVGSQRYLADIFKCGRQTIINGTKEVSVSNFKADYTSQRRAGGGRKKRR